MTQAARVVLSIGLIIGSSCGRKAPVTAGARSWLLAVVQLLAELRHGAADPGPKGIGADVDVKRRGRDECRPGGDLDVGRRPGRLVIPGRRRRHLRPNV